MPLKAIPSPEIITLAAAKDFVSKLKNKGVPVSDVREISSAYGVVSIDDPNYVDDGQGYQYIANIWGQDMELGLAMKRVGSGGLQAFINLAEGAFVNGNLAVEYATAFDAVIKLPAAASALDAALKL